MVEVPAELRAGLARETRHPVSGWTGFPTWRRGFLDQWRLRIDGRPMHGVCALVLPVRTTDGVPAVLKLTWPHPEACDEHLASGLVNGARDVRPPDGIRRPALPHVYWTMWPPYSAISWEPPVRVLLHTDLHHEHVLAGDREQWLAIDAKPLAGDAAFEVAPLLWNRWDEAISSADLGTIYVDGPTWSRSVPGSTGDGSPAGSSCARRSRRVERRTWHAERSRIRPKSPRLQNRHVCHVH